MCALWPVQSSAGALACRFAGRPKHNHETKNLLLYQEPAEMAQLLRPAFQAPASEPIRSNPRIWTTKIRTYPRLGEQKSEPIRGYPNLSEPIQTTAFFSMSSSVARFSKVAQASSPGDLTQNLT